MFCNGGFSAYENLATEAYDVLFNPEKRARYDRFGHAGMIGTGSGRRGGSLI